MKKQIHILGRLVTIQLVRSKSNRNTLNAVACVRCPSDSHRKDISDVILKGRIEQEKYLRKSNGEIVSMTLPFKSELVEACFLEELVNDMSRNFRKYFRFNPNYDIPGVKTQAKVLK